MNQRGRGLGQTFVVAAESSLPTQPPEGPFHDPTPGEHLEALKALGPLDNFQADFPPSSL